MHECCMRLSCSCFLGDGPGIELIPSSGEALHVLVWSKKYACDPELIPSPDRSWLCKLRPRRRESRKSTYKGEVRLR